ncbi:thiamine pyrophosphate-dependent enzyme [Xanthobacter pseudotagetidis]|uniref:thiamine pyrophosphate-dependent enzyme n=1 Tax=Xanthobacter pseudotagetidis TaxID=3119911 RepID=UPI0037277F14
MNEELSGPASVTGGMAVVSALRAHDVDRVFCVPGESFLGVVDALNEAPEIELVTARHEGGAGLMAVADARLSGRPGVVMVSRAPGASNAAIAIHNAHEDGVPLVVLVGQVPRPDAGLGAFQEVDYARLYAGIVKGVVRVDDPARAEALLAQAFHAATSGLPGPVLVILPEDMLEEARPPVTAVRFPVAQPRAGDEDVAAAAALLKAQERPLLIAGMALNTVRGREALKTVAERWKLPVAASARQPDILDNNHPGYVAHLGYATDRFLVERLREATALLAVGTRLGDVTSQGYSFPAAPRPAVPVIHIHESAEAVGAVRETALPILSGCAEFLERLAVLAPAEPRWTSWRDDLHARYLAWSSWRAVEASDGIVFGAVVEACARMAPADAIITADAGNFGGWLGRYFRYGGRQRFLNALSGSMGYGVPAAVAASLRHPERKVVCFVGDGGFLMTGNEIATARAYGANPVVVISDNGSYGTIRMHQERRFPGRALGTDLANPDFAALACAFGCEALSVSRPQEIEPALAAAFRSERLCVVHVRTSLRHISPSFTLAAAPAIEAAPA